MGPIVDGYGSDIGYASCFGENALFFQMQADLRMYRSLVLDGVRKEQSMQQIYRAVDALMVEQGYANIHARYPSAVIAHRVNRIPSGPLNRMVVNGFSLAALQSLQWFRRDVWNGDEQSARVAMPGLWAVEPHIGCSGVGAKWEELLVVTDSDAYWLDDDLPHVRRWTAAASSSSG